MWVYPSYADIYSKTNQPTCKLSVSWVISSGVLGKLLSKLDIINGGEGRDAGTIG